MAERYRIMDFLPVAGLTPLLVIHGPGREPMAKTGMPFSARQLKQFADYTTEAVGLSRAYAPLYEIWNEYNMVLGHVMPPDRIVGEGNPSDGRAAVHYARIAKIGTAAVKAAAPEAKVVVGASGDDPGWAWTQGIIRHGALEGADGVSIHLYNHCMRQPAADELIARMKDLQQKLKALTDGREVPIYVTEYGWPTGTGRCSSTEENSAPRYAHFILMASALPWVRGLWLYELKDESRDLGDLESNFGLFRYDNTPKPAACFVREAHRMVRGARRIEITRPAPDVVALRAVMADHQLVVAWSTDPARQTRARFPGPAGPVRQMCGTELAADAPVPLSAIPVVARYGLDQSPSIAFSD